MKLLYSKNKTPYIQFENGAKLIFSVSTENDKGFKYLAFNALDSRSVVVSGAKAKNKKIYKSNNFIGAMLNTNFKSPDNNTVPRSLRSVGFTKIVESYLRKTFKLLIDDDGYFPRGNIPTLQGILENAYTNKEDMMDDDPTATEDEDDEI
jgi:hypothetical protein